jgi:hypothetical protein
MELKKSCCISGQKAWQAPQHFAFVLYKDENGKRILACEAKGSLKIQMAQERIGPGKVPISIVLHIDCHSRLRCSLLRYVHQQTRRQASHVRSSAYSTARPSFRSVGSHCTRDVVVYPGYSNNVLLYIPTVTQDYAAHFYDMYINKHDGKHLTCDRVCILLLALPFVLWDLIAPEMWSYIRDIQIMYYC